MKKFYVLTIIVFLLAVFQFQAANASIKGVVSEKDGSVLTGAVIALVDESSGAIVSGAYSSTKGNYEIKSHPEGKFKLRVSLLGFKSEEKTIEIQNNDMKEFNFELLVDPVYLNSVVVSASRKNEKHIDAPASISVIGSKEISRSNNVSAIENIQSSAGVEMTQKGVIQQDYSSRGLNNVFNGTMLTLTDGRITGLPSLKANVSYLFHATNDDIERIEVVRGPGSALYGPNATNGIVNIITKSPFSSQGTSVSLMGGERNLLQGSLRHSGVIGEKFGYKISGMYTSAKDWEYSEKNDLRERDFDIKTFNGDMRLDYLFSQNTFANVSLGYSQAMNIIDLTDNGPVQGRDFSYYYAQGRFNSGDFFAQLYYNKNDAGNTYFIQTGDTVVDKSSKIGAHIQHGLKLWNFQRFTYGGDLFMTNPDTEGTINGMYEDDDEMTELGVYLQSETSLIDGMVELILGARYDSHSELEEAVLSPRAGISFKPSNNQNIRLTYNKAFQTPATSDLFLDIVAMRNIFPFPDDINYNLRGLGVPKSGFNFLRDETGSLLFHSTLYDGGASPIAVAGASALWDAAAAMVIAGIDDEETKQLLEMLFEAVPAPDATQVSALLGMLNLETEKFDLVDPNSVQNISRLKPTTNETFELGYKGGFLDKFQVGIDVYYSKVKNFITAQNLVTPNVFLNPNDIGTYLYPYIAGYLAQTNPELSEEEVQAMANEYAAVIAAGMAQVPLGTVTPQEAVSKTDLMLAPVNYGEIEYYGIDLELSYQVSKELSTGASYSYLSDNYFKNVDGKGDLSLNAPKHKGSVFANYFIPEYGLTIGARFRYIGDYKIKSSVYQGNIDPYGLIDLQINYDMAFTPGLGLTVAARNILDHQHIEFVNAPMIGRMVSARLNYKF